MTTQYLSQLVELDEKALNKISKTDLVKSITSSKFQFDAAERREKELTEKLEKQSADELAMKKMIAAMVNVELQRNEYSNETEWDKVELSSLVGALISKHMELLAGK
ncbi:hypothetical protein [Vibrio phage LP.1]|nr:hypothetical protein [Vibrio phage LP.1]